MVFIINSPKYGRLECLLDYDDYMLAKHTGNGKWGVRNARGKFYVQKRTSDGLVELHRFIAKAPKGMYVDHINGNTLDNRKTNLRICTNSANLRNGSVRTNNTSGYRGISFDKSRNKWAAYIKVKYRKISVGRYDTLEQAIEARKLAERLYWDI